MIERTYLSAITGSGAMNTIPADLHGTYSLPPGRALDICYQLEAAILQHRMRPGMKLAEDEVGDKIERSSALARFG